MKVRTKFRIILGILFFILSCEIKSDRFYNEVYVADLQRIPLIKPYVLFNSRGSDSTSRSYGWHLKLFQPQPESFVDHLNVSYINISKEIIYGHGQDGKTYFPNYWFAIVPSRQIEKTFKKEREWKDFLSSMGINSVSVVSVWILFDQFKKHSILPWINQG